MSQATENLNSAMQKGMRIKPGIGGFPYLAETLRAAGVSKNVWTLPSCQSLFITDLGAVVMEGAPLLTGISDVPEFDEKGIIRAVRIDQAGDSTFPEFLAALWHSGCTSYEVDFIDRTVSYFGCNGEFYVETYPNVAVAV